ncbi:DNA-directed RNA polymerase III subunit RPC9 [Psilocybe cubensis]|uniref:DNA-directed RNA polymerase III subunit RPC9 n=2 Tax=Psilocybe cubensis TaxID=181762 RepID=A0ACB8GY70_PSICU|nr:DNA-directed RNA polymerase III subunit RPC9 [Psilocybe cubensis]KAH9480382.1 DNA-directed RNA polymerase III subunit RPC9 [Psilocybe cubensis]
MEVLNPRSALLSNHEVLTLLRELESDHLVRTKAALRVKKEEEAAAANGGTLPVNMGGNPHLEASENLRTIEVEAIKYLSADYLPTESQTEEGITTLVKKLAPYSLTKAEKLQIVNLAPTLPVELYVIVEELEDRLGDQIDEILGHVKASIPSIDKTDPAAVTTNGIKDHAADAASSENIVMITENDDTWDDDADAVYDEEVYDDTGAGAGVEGDLEMDED